MHPPSRLEVPETAVADELDRLLLWARRVAPAQMSSTSITTLERITYSGPLRITDLAEREGVSQPSMTSLINRLANRRFVRRLPDPTDGRATLVDITPAGRDVLVKRHAERSEVLRRAVARLPLEHQATLVAAVDALRGLTQIIISADENSDD